MKANINIRMRLNKSSESLCELCGANQKQSLNLFDLKIGNQVITICDECNEQLLYKTLKASCYINHRIKDSHDIAIRNQREERKFEGVQRDVAIKGLEEQDLL